MKYRLFCSMLLLAFPIFLSAQTRPGGGGGGRSPGTRVPRNFPDTTSGLTPATTFFRGKVVMDDGSAVTEPAAIQSICNGQRHTETYTDSKGEFSFEFSSHSAAANSTGIGLGDADTTLANPTAPRGTQRDYRNCELQAYLPGFTSQTVELTSQSTGLDSYDVGRIAIHRMGQVEGLTLSATTAMAPNSAKKAFSKGLGKAARSQWEDAGKEFKKAVDIYPKFAAAWYQLGLAQEAQKKPNPRYCFEQALAADPRYVNPYRGLVHLALQARNWPELANFSSKLLALNPVSFPDVWLYNAVAHYFLQDLAAAEKGARSGLAADPQHSIPKLEYVLGMVLAARGAYPEAAEHMRRYIAHSKNPQDVAEGQKELAQIQQFLAKSDPGPEK